MMDYWHRILERLTEPYWRIRWEWWSVISYPSMPSLYNMRHTHQITNEDHAVMVERWEKTEPARGVPPSVRKHREKMTRLWGPDRSKWKYVGEDD